MLTLDKLNRTFSNPAQNRTRSTLKKKTLAIQVNPVNKHTPHDLLVKGATCGVGRGHTENRTSLRE